jgi:hypothetical protein
MTAAPITSLEKLSCRGRSRARRLVEADPVKVAAWHFNSPRGIDSEVFDLDQGRPGRPEGAQPR